MKQRYHFRNAAATAASLGAFLTGTVLASISVQPDPVDRSPIDAATRSISRESTRLAPPRFNERIIKIAGSDREVHLWDQAQRDGSTRPHYAIMQRNQGDSAPNIVWAAKEKRATTSGSATRRSTR